MWCGRDNKLSGTISPTLFVDHRRSSADADMRPLSITDFSLNRLSGTIDSAAFCNLPNLAALGADGMRLSGTIRKAHPRITPYAAHSKLNSVQRRAWVHSLSSPSSVLLEMLFMDLCRRVLTDSPH